MYSPYVPLKPTENNMSFDNKSCDNCIHRRNTRCIVAGYECNTQRKWPSVECDENWSGWELKVTKWDKRKMMLQMWIMSAVAGIINIFNRTRPKMPNNELTKNELDD